MSKPLTMTEEKEREYRACCTSGGTEVDPVFAELDATRAALAAAEAKLADERRHSDSLVAPQACDGSGSILVPHYTIEGEDAGESWEQCEGCCACASVRHAARRAAEVAND